MQRPRVLFRRLAHQTITHKRTLVKKSIGLGLAFGYVRIRVNILPLRRWDCVRVRVSIIGQSCLYNLLVYIFVSSIQRPFVATMSFAGYISCPFPSLSAFPDFRLLRPCSRFDLVWLRLLCDHGWIIHSGSDNNVR